MAEIDQLVKNRINFPRLVWMELICHLASAQPNCEAQSAVVVDLSKTGLCLRS